MILGIDPGKSGALVWLDKSGKIHDCEDMPERLDRLVEVVKFYAAETRFAVIEDVSAMTYVDKFGQKRGQGAAASFNFGFSTGMVHGVLAALNVRVWPVRPVTWKLAFGLSSDKSESLALARKKFPQDEDLFQLKKHDGRAEAALIAHFGSTRFK